VCPSVVCVTWNTVPFSSRPESEYRPGMVGVRMAHSAFFMACTPASVYWRCKLDDGQRCKYQAASTGDGALHCISRANAAQLALNIEMQSPL
jgi:hypothetical protein